MGKLLLRAKINELPQLINVLKEEMSIISPRPQDQRCFDSFREEDKAQILRVRPGLSGIEPSLFGMRKTCCTRPREIGSGFVMRLSLLTRDNLRHGG